MMGDFDEKRTLKMCDDDVFVYWCCVCGVEASAKQSAEWGDSWGCSVQADPADTAVSVPSATCKRHAIRNNVFLQPVGVVCGQLLRLWAKRSKQSPHFLANWKQ